MVALRWLMGKYMSFPTPAARIAAFFASAIAAIQSQRCRPPHLGQKTVVPDAGSEMPDMKSLLVRPKVHEDWPKVKKGLAQSSSCPDIKYIQKFCLYIQNFCLYKQKFCLYIQNFCFYFMRLAMEVCV